MTRYIHWCKSYVAKVKQEEIKDLLGYIFKKFYNKGTFKT